jgi:hypothetical protein
VARGEKNQALRHAFGISRTMKITNLEEVRRALVAQLAELKSRQGARRASSLEANRTRDVLHAALELYYDRFAAAVDVAFEDDDELRVSLLSLIPRRKDRRAVAAKPPVVAELPHAATD